jgi:hypothetical protein
MGPFSSESKTSSRTQTISGPQTATGGSLNIATQGRGELQIGGLSFDNLKNSQVTINATDQGAIAAASAALEKAVNAQANTTAAALSSLGNLTETRITDGANISADVTKSGFTMLTIVAIGAVILFFLLRRK